VQPEAEAEADVGTGGNSHDTVGEEVEQEATGKAGWGVDEVEVVAWEPGAVVVD
jgi:hypothetical protein